MKKIRNGKSPNGERVKNAPLPHQHVTTEPTTSASMRVLRLPAVIQKTGLGRDSIYRLGRLGEFPRVVKLTVRSSGWLEREIDQWVAQRAALRETSSAA